MDIHLEKRNAVLAEHVIKGLQSRNMSGYYAKNKEEALKTALELIPKGSSISMGGLHECAGNRACFRPQGKRLSFY